MTLGSLAEFAIENAPHRCTLKSAVVEYAALQRDLEIERIDAHKVLIRTPSALLPFTGLNGPDSTVVGRWLCDHKEVQRTHATRAGLRVNEFAVFPADSRSGGLAYARTLGWPVVVKPNNLSRSRGVTTDVRDAAAFNAAWRRARQAIAERNRFANARILVERQVAGDDYRLFVVAGRVVSVTHKARANVTGDGVKSVADLIAAKNEQRAANAYLREFPIPQQQDVLDALTASGRTLDYVPPEGERLTLRSRSTLNAGGDSVDVTEQADPFFCELAVAAVQAVPGVAYAGVDVITGDITTRPGDTEYVLGEVEYSPAPLAHFPAVGTSRDMAGAIVSHYLDTSAMRKRS